MEERDPLQDGNTQVRSAGDKSTEQLTIGIAVSEERISVQTETGRISKDDLSEKLLPNPETTSEPLRASDTEERGRRHAEQTTTLPALPQIAAPALIRPAPGPLQPPQSIWAKKAQSMKLRKGSPSGHRNEYSLPTPPMPIKGRRQSYMPVVPSPLNPASSGSEGEASRRPSHSSSGLEISTGDSGDRSISLESEPPRKSQVLLYSSTQTLPQLSLIDIGREYDRYPLRTPRNSIMLDPSPVGTPPKRHSSQLIPTDQLLIGFDGSNAEKSFFPYATSDDITKPNFIDADFPLFMDEKEEDDYLHNPEKDFDKNINSSLKGIGWRGWISFFGFWLLILGLLCLFVILPILTFTGYVNKPKSTGEKPWISPWEYIPTNYEFPILSGIRTNMIDPDTPEYAKTRKGVNGETLKLVFSDEFNVDGRTFYEGDDQFWTAVDLHYAATQDLEWYDPDAATTLGGTLRLKLDAWKNHNLNYRSGMLQSWNKLCFKGGVLEVSASLAGPGGKPGLWPGIWTLGNLARPGHLATSDGVWPYSYDNCDAGITPNQSSPDGLSFLPGQRLSQCTCVDEDHPSLGVGRGAPEIDALEGSVDGTLGLGVVSQSSQVAPYDVWYTPDYEYLQIYNSSVTTMNTWCGGPFQQAISGITTLNNKWYDGEFFQKYAFEYTPGKGTGGITWFVGDEPTFSMKGEATRQNGNIGPRDVSREPMSIILNLGLSNNWAYIDWPGLEFPTTMYIDYVRIYQPEGDEMLTCDPPGYPTTDYIKEHLNAYMNPNLTSWEAAGYSFPKNSLMHGCEAP